MIKNRNKIINPINIPILDSLRAFAALSVCLFHFWSSAGISNDNYLKDFFSVGKYGVQMFFVISGFIIPWSMYHAGYKFKNFFLFLFKRFIRLEPPYLISLIIATVLLIMRDKVFGISDGIQELSFKRIFLHIGYLIPFFDDYRWINNVYWTLAIEFQFYFFMALIFVPIIKWAKPSRYIVYIIFLSGGLLKAPYFLTFWLPIFFIGILLFLYKSKQITSHEYSILTVFAFALCAFYYNDYPCFYIQLFYVFLAVFFILFLDKVKIPILDSLGKLSYSIYLLHQIIGSTIINMLLKYTNCITTQILVIFIGIIVTVFFSWLMFKLIETPSKQISSRILYKP